jgi:hypothetical protein
MSGVTALVFVIMAQFPYYTRQPKSGEQYLKPKTQSLAALPSYFFGMYFLLRFVYLFASRGSAAMGD